MPDLNCESKTCGHGRILPIFSRKMCSLIVGSWYCIRYLVFGFQYSVYHLSRKVGEGRVRSIPTVCVAAMCDFYKSELACEVTHYSLHCYGNLTEAFGVIGIYWTGAS